MDTNQTPQEVLTAIEEQGLAPDQIQSWRFEGKTLIVMPASGEKLRLRRVEPETENESVVEASAEPEAVTTEVDGLASDEEEDTLP